MYNIRSCAPIVFADDVEGTNWELAERFGITMEDLPLVKLFVRGKEVATLHTDMHCDSIRDLITKHTGRKTLAMLKNNCETIKIFKFEALSIRLS